MRRFSYWSILLVLATVCATPALADSLAVTNAAAIDGNFGLAVTVDGSTNKANVQDYSPNDETVYRASFKIDMNNLVMAEGARHDIFIIRSAPGGPLGLNHRNEAFLWAQYFGAQTNPYKINLVCRRDDGKWLWGGKTSLPPSGARTLMVEWEAASGPGANDGACRIYFNGNLKGALEVLDNDERAVGSAWIGSVNRIDPATNGTMYFDSFESFRTLAP